MPVTDNQMGTGGNQSGFDAMTFLALAQNPQAFSEKLAELTQAKQDAEKARDEADAKIRLVASAEEVTALLEQTRINKVLSEQAIAQAQEQAKNILANAQEDAMRIMESANLHLAEVQARITDSEAGHQARETILSSKEEVLQSALVKAQEQEAIAKRLQELAENEIEQAKQKQTVADAYLEKLQQRFSEFIRSVT